jgi:hypothetical protein
VIFTNEELVACVQREIRQRKRVYPRLVERGTMRPEDAEYETEVMQAVLNLLQEQVSPTLL